MATSTSAEVTLRPGGGASTVIPLAPEKVTESAVEEVESTSTKTDDSSSSRSEWLPALICCTIGTHIWLIGLYLDYTLSPRNPQYAKIPKSVSISYSFCAVAYACNLLLNLLKLGFEGNCVKVKLHILGIYISLLSSSTYFLTWAGVSSYQLDVNSVVFLPMRWVLYFCTMPAIWWILAHVSSYTLNAKLYVLFLNWIMLIAGALATIPGMVWPEKVFWMALSCVPFPELCYHMWRMISDAIDAAHITAVEGTESASTKALHFIRVYGQFSYQFFPAIYFAAFDGSLPVHVSELLWALCDWCLKMVMTSSLMEVNFVTISQRHKMAQLALEDARRLDTIMQLSEAIERKDDFLSALSHELRTPLNGIIGLSDGLLNGAGGVLAPNVSKIVTTIKMSGRRLLHLINDILDAAKVKRGQVMIKHECVNLEQLIEDVLDLTIPLVKKGVTMKRRVQRVPLIEGDNSRIMQILYNLVGNACKFTQSGEIVIMTGMDEDNRRVYLAVRDTGIGIAPDRLHTIFAPYSQSDTNIVRHFGGTGLGLHFVKELVHAHHGQIELDSMLGVGSTFCCWFPLEQPTQQGSAEGSNQGDTELLTSAEAVSEASALLRKSAPQLPGADGSADEKQDFRLLVVDHDEEARNLVHAMLGGLYDIEQCTNAEEMFAALQSMPDLPSAILMDYDMDDGAGDHIYQQIMAKYGDCQMPVIFTSANATQLRRLRNMEDANLQITIVEKPFTQAKLIAAIEQVIDLVKEQTTSHNQEGSSVAQNVLRHEDVIVACVDFSALMEMTQIMGSTDILLILSHVHKLMQQMQRDHPAFHMTVFGTEFVLLMRIDPTSREEELVGVLNGLQEVMHEIQSFTSTFAYPLRSTAVLHSGSCHTCSLQGEDEIVSMLVSSAIWFAHQVAIEVPPGSILVTSTVMPYLSKVALMGEVGSVSLQVPGGAPIGVTVLPKGSNWRGCLASLQFLEARNALVAAPLEADGSCGKATMEKAPSGGGGEAGAAEEELQLFMSPEDAEAAEAEHLERIKTELKERQADIQSLHAQIAELKADLAAAQLHREKNEKGAAAKAHSNVEEWLPGLPGESAEWAVQGSAANYVGSNGSMSGMTGLSADLLNEQLSGMARMLRELPSLNAFLEGLNLSRLESQLKAVGTTPLSLATVSRDDYAKTFGIADAALANKIHRAASRLLSRCILKLDSIMLGS